MNRGRGFVGAAARAVVQVTHRRHGKGADAIVRVSPARRAGRPRARSR